MNLEELKKALDAELKGMEALLDKADTEKRSLTDDEQKTFDGHETKAVELRGKIKTAETRQLLADERRGLQLGNGRRTTPDQPQQQPHGQTETEERSAGRIQFRNYGSRARHFGPVGAESDERAYFAGRWLAATIYAHEESRQWCHDHGVEIRSGGDAPRTLALTELRAMGTNNNPAGGYLVFPTLSTAIIDLRERYGALRRAMGTAEPMTSDQTVVPRRAGGLTAYHVGENPSSATTQSQLAMSQVTLNAKKTQVLTAISNELEEDAFISVADRVAEEMGHAFAFREDADAFMGDGTSTYGGVLGFVPRLLKSAYAGSVATAASGHLKFGSLTLDDFILCTALLPLYASQGDPRWYVTKAGYEASMARLSYAAGGNTATNIAGRPMPMFLGYPVEFVQVMNATLTDQASTILCLFGDIRMAAKLGQRKGITIETDRSVYFLTDQLAVKGTERVAINVHDTGNTTDAGPMVALKTPAS